MDLLSQIRYGGILYILLLIAITMHEFGHAFCADKMGDRLPRLNGRVSLNPVAHMDMMGTVILPIVTIAMSIGAGIPFVFGWGKPVMTQPPQGKSAIRFDIITTAGGVSMNLVVALISAILAGILAIFGIQELVEIAIYSIMINSVLFVLNMIPIPPLDGSRFLKHAVKMSDETYMNLARWGLPLLLLVLFLPITRDIFDFLISTVSSAFILIAQAINNLGA